MSSAGQFAKQAANVYDEASDGAIVERSVLAGESISEDAFFGPKLVQLLRSCFHSMP
jgi:hypothetical protein